MRHVLSPLPPLTASWLAAPLLIVALLAAPAPAQILRGDDAGPESSDPKSSDKEEGFSLLEEGAKLILRGLMEEMQPAIEDMGRALTELEPAMRDMARLVDDIRNYEAPRMLPNGDILIPRRPGSPPPPRLGEAPEAGPQPDPQTGEIDL